MNAEIRDVDWEVWQHIPEAKLWEAVALSLNLDPRRIKINRHSWMASDLIFEERKEFSDRLLVAQRNLTSGNLMARHYNSASPNVCSVSLGEFSVWALSIGWTLPPVLTKIGESVGANKVQQPPPTEKPLGTRERNTIARIIAALTSMAKVDLSEPHKAAGAIEAETARLGIQVSDDTIAKWLNEAATALGRR